jgi:hypothetical protein
MNTNEPERADLPYFFLKGNRMNIKDEVADSKAFRGGSATDEAHAHHDMQPV